MNISPILLLVIGSTFGILYGLIITIGWAITRKNRKIYHEAKGYSMLKLFDLQKFRPLEKEIKTVSLNNNIFLSEDEKPIDINSYDCYIVEIASENYPKIQKGDLIFVDRKSGAIRNAFRVPSLSSFR